MTSPTNKTMFGKAKHEYLRDIISIRSPESATGSVRELTREFYRSKTRARKLRIARATQLVSNRALASAKRQSVSPRERGELKKVARIYRDAAGKMFDSYGRTK